MVDESSVSGAVTVPSIKIEYSVSPSFICIILSTAFCTVESGSKYVPLFASSAVVFGSYVVPAVPCTKNEVCANFSTRDFVTEKVTLPSLSVSHGEEVVPFFNQEFVHRLEHTFIVSVH